MSDMMHHVWKYWFSLTPEEQEEKRKEIMKRAERVKTPFGEIVMFKDPFYE